MPDPSGLLTLAAGPGPASADVAAPEVSVCIASWNCRDLLRGCLASLDPHLQGVRLQTIVVDNASSDGAPEMVAAEFPHVLLVRNQDNRGFARACNQAARLAQGRYLFFLNNDTVVPEGALRRLLVHARTHPRAGMIGPGLRGADGRIQVSCRPRPTVAALLHRTSLLRRTGLLRRHYRRYRREGIRGASNGSLATLMGAALLLPRAVFFACGGWDEDYTFGGEDFDLSTRIGQTHELRYCPEVTITHYGRTSTRANVEYSAPNVAIGFARYLRKSGSAPPSLLLYKFLVTLDAPIQLVGKSLQYGWRRCSGRRDKARQSLQRIKEVWYFLTRGLREFWKV